MDLAECVRSDSTIISQIAAGRRRVPARCAQPYPHSNYVADTCSAFLSVAESEATLGKVINAASNFEISIGDTAALIAEVMGANLKSERMSSACGPRPPR